MLPYVPTDLSSIVRCSRNPPKDYRPLMVPEVLHSAAAHTCERQRLRLLGAHKIHLLPSDAERPHQ